MSEKTLTRGQLVRLLTRGTNDPALVVHVEAALARLGWAQRDAFGRGDVAAIATTLGEIGRDHLAAEGGEYAPLVGQIDPLLRIARDAAAKANQA